MSTAKTGSDHEAHHARVGPRALLALAGFRRLLFTRFSAQWGDGLFQAGLAGAVLFNPEREADPLAIAAGFTALLLPYSIIGPFAGALLDRWDRRRVLVAANVLRGALIVTSALSVAVGASGTTLFTLALVVIGVSRFINSGLSASLPHVVPVRNLVEANALATTLGAVIAVLGAGCAVGLRAIFGDDNLGSGTTTAIACLGSAGSAWFAIRFARGALGPDEVNEPSQTAVAVARGLYDGGRAAVKTPTVLAAFVALLAHRMAFGVALLLTVLLIRFRFDAGLGGLGQVAGLFGAGILLAGLVTARIVAAIGRRRALAGGLLLGAVAVVGFGLPLTMPTTLAAALVISFAGQVVKLCVDAAVQRDIGDDLRGRVFALYDTLFNVAQVVSIALAALVVAPDGASPLLVLGAGACYLVGVGGFALVSRGHA
ncbi:MFS transporter [Actinokineospora globicatena]|uniref:MFS transporter n=1 Tax=Actinokineospora globicatena TaxID=103729 RepID=UPI0020A3431C|nr:MFS transporter [Actinokineospora globicatena]MCP2301272.1 putative arabinose efflux permease, MFS family [Actinokineospora globicatena]GLW77089.1 MFS transporter [Actinokineospora globicatena]GLW83923.1 MFS transporter [Actinokineospora globicatena]